MKRVKRILKEHGIFIFALIVVLLIKVFVFSPVRVTGPSMEPTLLMGDIMILNKLSYRFQDINRFDIVVVRVENELLIKRVIGLPGEEISFHGDRLLVNNEEVKEPFDTSFTDDFDILHAMGRRQIPENNFLVLGDNRMDSLDSRSFGFIPKSRILGRANFTILPFNRFGRRG